MRRLPTLLLICGLAAGCGTPYVWVDEWTEARAPDTTLIAPGDLLNVRVYNQEPMSVRARVRADGKISVPLAGDVVAAGKAPAALSTEIAAKLKEFVVSPVVTVVLEEPRATSVAVLGEVAHPGVYPVDSSAGILQALAAAGGLTEYASHDAIYVVRAANAQRIRFSLPSLESGTSRASGFRLRAGDAVMVE